jgi:N-carbamoylputrescine amidase
VGIARYKFISRARIELPGKFLCASYFFFFHSVKELSPRSAIFSAHVRIQSMADKFTIGLVQMKSTKNAEENLSRAIEKIREAASLGAQIICMDELFRGEYFCRTEDAALFDLAEAIPGPATDALAKVAKEKKVAIVASLFERRAAGVYHNSCAVLDADGSYLGKYRKMHIPDDPLYYEKFYFTPGDLGFPNFNTKYARIGIQICWDQWYPEGSRLTALSGAQVIFYPTSIGWHPAEKSQVGAAQLEAWRTIQRAHAIANGTYVAVVNRVGYEGDPKNGDPGLEFWGNSFVADPFGQIAAQAGSEKEEILVVECDPKKSEETRRNWPFLRDRRIDAYQPILNRWLGE